MRNILQRINHTLLILTFTLLSVNLLQAQTASWQTYQTTGNLKIENSQPISCTTDNVQAEYIFLKLTNLGATGLTATFRIDYYYVGSGCATCDNDEYKYTFHVPANSSITADCSSITGPLYSMAIFKQFLNKPNPRQFDKFEITQIVVE